MVDLHYILLNMGIYSILGFMQFDTPYLYKLRQIKYLCFRILEDFNRFLGPKNPYIDT